MDNTAIRLMLWAGTMAAVSAYSSTVAHARTQMSERESDAPEQAAGLNGLGTGQTGQVAGSSVDRTGIVIAPSDVGGMKAPHELSVAGPAAAALTPPAGTTSQVLAAEIAARLGPLEDCRISVARRRHVTTGGVAADRLVLRWMITKTGRAFGAQAVATTPTDDGVLYCVKRQMTGWTFPRPSGGPLPIERDFTFRRVPLPGK